jgi:hypothetical protein
MSRPVILAVAGLLAALCTAALAQPPQVRPPPLAPSTENAQRPPVRTAPPTQDEEEACRARHAAYQRSQACYAQYRSFQAVRPEALSACGPPLLDPSPECGPPAPYR